METTKITTVTAANKTENTTAPGALIAPNATTEGSLLCNLFFSSVATRTTEPCETDSLLFLLGERREGTSSRILFHRGEWKKVCLAM